MAANPGHHAIQHRLALPGVQAVTLVSGRSFPRHAHDQFGIGLLTGGAQRSWSGIGAVEAAAGDAITVNPGEMHDGLPVGGRARTWRMLYADPSVVTGEIEGELSGQVEFGRPVMRDPVLAERLACLFAAITASAPARLAVEEGVLRVVVRGLRRHGARRPSPPPAASPVTAALQRLHDAPEHPISLAELAALSGVSRFQLLRGFARATGTTPHAYLVQLRVRRARVLLAAGAMPAEAALAAGFADQSHLTRAFVRQLGVTPARYRAALA